MDVRQKIQPALPRKVLSVAFNNAKSAFAIGLETGFWVLQTRDAEPHLKKELTTGIGLAQMMGVSNILALVGGGPRSKFAANKVIIWDENQHAATLSIDTVTPIRGVKIVLGTVYVALQHSLQVHNFSNGNIIHKYQTAENLGGILCLSDTQIAFPGRVEGQIQIVDIATGNVSIILGHDAPLRALCFSKMGDMLASASDKGTMIHVYNTRTLAVICKVRRGMEQARIYDMCFSPSGDMLACTSDRGTLHIFDIPRPGRNNPPDRPILSTLAATSLGSRPGSSNSNSTTTNNAATATATAAYSELSNGWGWLAKVPLLPKAFSDQYSFASAKFDLGEEPEDEPEMTEFAVLGTFKAAKGVIGWFEEYDLVVVGAGYDARWEKYRVAEMDDGKRFVTRIGWKRYYYEMQ